MARNLTLFKNRILLQQGPFNGRPTIQRVLIVTPSSLVKNWEKEFRRWLGRERITVFTADQVICFTGKFEEFCTDLLICNPAQPSHRVFEAPTMPSNGSFL